MNSVPEGVAEGTASPTTSAPWPHDEYLSFEDHITNLCNKISKSLFCMNRVKNFFYSKAMKTLYFAMVHSHISYCINVYRCANITTLNKLVLKQKEAIRIVCNAGVSPRADLRNINS